MSTTFSGEGSEQKGAGVERGRAGMRTHCCGGMQSMERGMERCHDCPSGLGDMTRWWNALAEIYRGTAPRCSPNDGPYLTTQEINIIAFRAMFPRLQDSRATAAKSGHTASE